MTSSTTTVSTAQIKPTLAFTITTLVIGLVGLALSLIVYIEKLHLLANPNYTPSCTFGGIVSCSPVMASWQASVFFGVPNPIWGIIGFTGVILVALVQLFTKRRFASPTLWLFYAIASTAAFAFCAWLMSQAYFDIKALCIYCIGVWIVTILLTTLSWGNYARLKGSESVALWVGASAVIIYLVFIGLGVYAFRGLWL